MNGTTAHRFFCIRTQAFQRGSRRPVQWRWQEIHDRIEERNNPDILDCRTAVERDNPAGLDAKAKSIDQILLRQLTRGKILFQ
jgi:hypothetical protein